MAEVKVNKELCKGCLLCTAICPKGLLKKGEAFNSFGFYHVEYAADGDCTGCALCAEVCPDVALEVWK